MRYLSAFDVVGLLCGKKRLVGKIDASSCIEKTCEKVDGCSFYAITEAELVHRFEIYCNIHRTRRK